MILLATGNKHKVQEIKAILGDVEIRIVPPEWDYEEGLTNLMDNAIGKAVSAKAFAQNGEIVLAEDTGLFVTALNGQPGVASARYAGEDVTFDENVEKLLRNLKGVPMERRQAHFMTVACACLPDGRMAVSCGRVDGLITPDKRGAQGFGYDPIFLIPAKNKTLAEIPTEGKNELSHRARALTALLPYLKNLKVSS